MSIVIIGNYLFQNHLLAVRGFNQSRRGPLVEFAYKDREYNLVN